MMLHIHSSETGSSLTEVQDVDVQPNAVDLRIDKVFYILNKTFEIDEDRKLHRGSIELAPTTDGYWTLEPGTYEIVMQNIIAVGEGEAGWVITRSTLNRNGVFITSGLYDSGYSGSMAGALHVTVGPMRIKRGTRVGQFLLFKSETLKMYSGSYGFDNKGVPKKDEEKYHSPQAKDR